MNEPETLSPMLIKSLFKKLVRAAGGQDAAAAELEVCRQRVSQLQNTDNPEHAKDVPTYGQIWTLERFIGRSVVFAGLADAIEPRPAPANACPMRHGCEMVREVGDAITAVSKAVADGEVTPDEYAACDKELADVEERVAIIRASLRRTVVPMREAS